MLNIFSAHYQYAKGARLYCQLMMQLETSKPLKVLQPMGTMLSVTLVMNGPVPGVTSVLSRD